MLGLAYMASHADFNGDKNPFWGRKHNSESKHKMMFKKQWVVISNVLSKGKIVCKINPNTNIVVGEFLSASCAAKEEGITRTSMSKRCNKGVAIPLNGFIWAWKEEL